MHTYNYYAILRNDIDAEANFANKGLDLITEDLGFEEGFPRIDVLTCRGFQLDSTSIGESIFKSFNHLIGPWYSAMSGKLEESPEQQEESMEKFKTFIEKVRPNVELINSEFEKIFAPQQ